MDFPFAVCVSSSCSSPLLSRSTKGDGERTFGAFVGKEASGNGSTATVMMTMMMFPTSLPEPDVTSVRPDIQSK